MKDRLFLNTRAADRAYELDELLLRESACSIRFPALSTRPCLEAAEIKRALEGLPPGSWVLFTSAAGVRAAASCLVGCAGGIDSLPCRIGVVGERTGAVLSSLGREPDLVAEKADSEGLAACLARFGKEGERSGRKVLLLRGSTASGVLPEMLINAGLSVDCLTIYQSLPGRPSDEEYEALDRALALSGAQRGETQRLDMLVLTSAEAARNLLSLAGGGERGEKRRRALLAVPAAVIGEKTAATARSLGFSVPVIAPRASLGALVGAMREYYLGLE